MVFAICWFRVSPKRHRRHGTDGTGPYGTGGIRTARTERTARTARHGQHGWHGRTARTERTARTARHGVHVWPDTAGQDGTARTARHGTDSMTRTARKARHGGHATRKCWQANDDTVHWSPLASHSFSVGNQIDGSPPASRQQGGGAFVWQQQGLSGSMFVWHCHGHLR